MNQLALRAAVLAVLLAAGCDKHRAAESSQPPAASQKPSPVVVVPATTSAAATTTATATTSAAATAEDEHGCADEMKGGGECSGGCDKWDEAASEVAKRPIPADARWQQIAVSGMVCGGCERRVIASVGTIDGVIAVEADAELGQVRVAMARGRDLRQAAVDRINSLGYKAH